MERELRDELEVPGTVVMITSRTRDEVISEIHGILDAYERQGITTLRNLPENVKKVLRVDFDLLGIPHNDLREQPRRCNKCHRPMDGTTAADGICYCGGLIENGMPLPVENCDLCNNPITAISKKNYNGRKLCGQCYAGEIENPEHALPPVE